MFIPEHENSFDCVMKNRDKYCMLDKDMVLQKQRNMNIIRWVLDTTSLRRNLDHCTPDEIADDKIKRLTELVKDRPELERIINDTV